MRIAIAQIDPVVGNFELNVSKIKTAYERACESQARLLLTPELSVSGYPPHDLVDRPEIFERNEKALKQLLEITRGKACALIVGTISKNPASTGRSALNLMNVIEDGKVVFTQAKSLLPTYDVFDESRYFEPASKVEILSHFGFKIAPAICEDLWANDPTFGRELYGQRDPVPHYCSEGADLIISTSASPYMWGKNKHREEVHAAVARQVGAPMIYLNQVGATDEILFDGGSFAIDKEGKLVGRLPFFQTAFALIDFDEKTKSLKWIEPDGKGREDKLPSDIEILHRALVDGIREYFKRTGFKTAILGLSGGIDSAVVAVLAAEALGAKSVLGVAMPSQHSSSHSLSDAEALARNLGCGYEVRPIKFMYATMARELSEGRGELASIAQENLQSRLRGLILMTLSNHYSALVLTTGNKSELATGYGTLYGDMAGALAPIGDVLKTRVYELARYINEKAKKEGKTSPIPDNTITKAPSAELKPGQVDQDTLPPYEHLDALLFDYLERSVSVSELEARYGALQPSKDWVREILRKIEINEFKRRQAAPVLKISAKAFGIGRRIPIAKFWDR
jgi:NAD+ synthase (glutamine-hydrolysing)